MMKVFMRHSYFEIFPLKTFSSIKNVKNCLEFDTVLLSQKKLSVAKNQSRGTKNQRQVAKSMVQLTKNQSQLNRTKC